LDDNANFTLASSPGSGAGSAVGAAVVTGTTGSITFTLNDTDGIAAASVIIIKIGTIAAFGATGDKQIKTPGTAGSYKINVKTKTSGGTVLDQADTMIAVIEPLTVTAIKPAPAPAPAPAPVPAPAPAPAAPSGGGAGGAPVAPAGATARFRGYAYPTAEISIFRNGALWRKDLAAQNGTFEILISGVPGGLAKFDLSAKDTDGRASIVLTLESSLVEGGQNLISNIIFPPTIELAETTVRQGERFIARGQAFPNSDVIIVIDGGAKPIITKSISSGIWGLALDTTLLKVGEHTIKVQERISLELQSTFGKVTPFKIFARGVVFCKGPDINADGRVDLQDFSILLFWWKAKPPGNPCADINGDGVVNLVDFSILLYNWMRRF
jgi:hypothetical protein